MCKCCVIVYGVFYGWIVEKFILFENFRNEFMV